MFIPARGESRIGPFLAMTLCLSLASQAAWSRVGPDEKIDKYVRAQMEQRHVPGLALVVLRNHRTILAANHGLADLSSKQPVTARTSFEIASMSKQFTAAAVLLLAEQGKLSIDDPLSRHLPDLPASWEAITLRQLMNHTAGLADDWDNDNAYFTSRSKPSDFLHAMQDSPLRFPPGTDWSYSAGPFVLGLVIEKVSGKPYAQFMRESIFAPLGMNSTQVNDVQQHTVDRASGYVFREGSLQDGVVLPAIARARADVGIRTTTRDLALWDEALDTGALLSEASRKEMFSPGKLGNGEPIAYGLGWYIAPFRGHTEIAHGGSFRTGFNSVIARYPDDRLTVIILTNQFKARSPEMARAIAAFYNDDYRPIETMPVRPDKHPSRTRATARIMVGLKAGDHSRELLPGIGRLAGWSRTEVREELSGATAPTFIDCQDLRGRDATAFGEALAFNCFYRTAGDKTRYWSVGFTTSGRVASFELEQ